MTEGEANIPRDWLVTWFPGLSDAMADAVTRRFADAYGKQTLDWQMPADEARTRFAAVLRTISIETDAMADACVRAKA